MKISRVIVVAVVVLAGCGTEPTPPQGAPRSSTSVREDPREAPKKDRSYAAPDFTVTTFEGDRFRLGEHKGTPVVLNFWESW